MTRKTDPIAAARAEIQHHELQPHKPLDPLGPGQWVGGQYCLCERIGSGTYGLVFAAEQSDPVRRKVAIKVLRLGLDTEEVVARFEAERQALAIMDHPGIAKVYDAGATKTGRPFFVMELVQGKPINDFCDNAQLSITERLGVFLSVCHAVIHAHVKGVIHRDLKPSNVLVAMEADRPRSKVIDFGVAKAVRGDLTARMVHTRRNQVLGTPAYMSPEQTSGSGIDVDTRADVYALGGILYELLTGATPVQLDPSASQDLLAIEKAIRELRPTRPSKLVGTLDAEAVARRRGLRPEQLRRRLRGDLDSIVLKCLEKDRALRYSTVSEVVSDIEKHLRHEPLTSSRNGFYRAKKFVQRRRGVCLSILSVFLSLVTGLWFTQAVLADYRSLEDAQVAIELLQEEARLWPAGPNQVDAMNDWIARGEGLLSREADLRAVTPRDDFHESTLNDLLARLDHLRALIEVVRSRRNLALANKRDFDAAAESWAQTVERVRAHPVYEGLDLEIQRGLVPLGPDPRSGLEEFAVLGTGRIPTRTPQRTLAFSGDTAVVMVLIPGGLGWVAAQREDPLQPDYAPHADFSTSPDLQLDPFFLGKFEITQAQFSMMGGYEGLGDDRQERKSVLEVEDYAPAVTDTGLAVASEIMRGSPSQHPEGETHPVENVSWDQARVALARAGLELPTEAQWLYGARAHSDKPYGHHGSAREFNAADSRLIGWEPTWQGDKAVDDGHALHAPVGTYAPNAFGIHDCVGNVWEWCWDEASAANAAARPGDGLRGRVGPTDVSGLAVLAAKVDRVIHGGSWRHMPTTLGDGDNNRSDIGYPTLGVRAARRIEMNHVQRAAGALRTATVHGVEYVALPDVVRAASATAEFTKWARGIRVTVGDTKLEFANGGDTLIPHETGRHEPVRPLVQMGLHYVPIDVCKRVFDLTRSADPKVVRVRGVPFRVRSVPLELEPLRDVRALKVAGAFVETTRPVQLHGAIDGISSVEIPAGERLLVRREFELDGHPFKVVSSVGREPESWVVPSSRLDLSTKEAGGEGHWQKRMAWFRSQAKQGLAFRRCGEAAPERSVALTVDLCWSLKHFEEALWSELERLGEDTRPVPVTLFVSGRWIDQHPLEMQRLLELGRQSRLQLTWGLHSWAHPKGGKFMNGFTLDELREDTLRLETRLLEWGIVPTVYYRFPGLVHDEAHLNAVLDLNLLPIDCDSWLAVIGEKSEFGEKFGNEPESGGVILVHGNGNEPAGIRALSEWMSDHPQWVLTPLWKLVP